MRTFLDGGDAGVPVPNALRDSRSRLAHDRWIEQVVEDVIARAEYRAGCTFGNRPALQDIVRVGMAMPSFLEQGL
ncbi:MAG TPA: hypothetical protein VGC79_36655 [Polyangiaceae bacterium]